MTFRGIKLEYGMRFYTFISDDEYEIVTLVNTTENEGQFMNEETFEIVTISEKELDDSYTLLNDYKEWIVCNFKLKDEFRNDKNYKSYQKSIWLNNSKVPNFLSDELMSYPYNMDTIIKIVVYKFLPKSVFNKLLNYIIQYNQSDLDISDIDSSIEAIYRAYSDWISANNVIIECSLEDSDSLFHLNIDIDMEKIVDSDKKRVPDAIIDIAETALSTFILTYDVYRYDDSINLNNVNMKYFFIYNNDKYYIVLYIIDQKKDSDFSAINLKNHKDVVDFMLK